MDTQTGYHKLIVYQKAKQLAILVYLATKTYPSSEIHGLVSQMRRAAVSIAANIVEGYTKSTTKDFIRYLDISLGSLAELEFYFELGFELKYLDQETYLKFQNLALEINKLLRSFQRSLREKTKV
jgi:four helix bundle protein